MVEVAATELLKEVSRVYKEKSCLTAELLSALNFVFQAPLQQALDLIDKRHVSRLTCPSGRQIYQVLGSSGTPYMCLTKCQYCSCQAYKYSVLKRKDSLWCKHILAIKLSEAMGIIQDKDISDEELVKIICSID